MIEHTAGDVAIAAPSSGWGVAKARNHFRVSSRTLTGGRRAHTEMVSNSSDVEILMLDLGPFPSLRDLNVAIGRDLMATAAHAERNGSELASYSHDVVPRATVDGCEFYVSALTTFAAGSASVVEGSRHLEVNSLDLGPFTTVRSLNAAVEEEVAIATVLHFERRGVVFAGLSHSVVAQPGVGGIEYFVSAIITYWAPGVNNSLSLVRSSSESVTDQHRPDSARANYVRGSQPSRRGRRRWFTRW